MSRKIAIVGSTGSIGRQTLDVISAWPEQYEVTLLAARRSWKLLAEQSECFKPDLVALLEDGPAWELKRHWGNKGPALAVGMDELCCALAESDADLVVSSLVGMAGLRPTLTALEAGKDVALANKEALVVGGELVMGKLKRCVKGKVQLFPIDSEHSAIFQALKSGKRSEVRNLILTASGGPFRKLPASKLGKVRAVEALKHPTWDMGAKITIDSATLMNKGFEVIEAHHLFGVPFDNIQVWIHPQSIVHSMVEFVDGSVVAQLGPPDMRTPIQYALSYPDRLPKVWSGLTLDVCRNLSFEEPRWNDFPCLKLAYQVGKEGGTLPAVLNGANEVLVELFLKDKISFTDIPVVLEAVCEAHSNVKSVDLESIVAADEWSRRLAEQMCAHTGVGR